jgi:hypothetical protein
VTKESDIDFSFFIGQQVTDVNTESNLPLGIIFECGWLMIECPWRLRSNDIIVGKTDCREVPERYSHQSVKDVLVGKRIARIFHDAETSDLSIHFDVGLTLDLFHDSSFFEGWQLQGNNDFLLVSTPGGKYSLFEPES